MLPVIFDLSRAARMRAALIILTLWRHGMLLPRRAPAMDAGCRVLVFDHEVRSEERRTTRTCKADPAPASDRTWCRSSGPLRCTPRRFGLEGWRTHLDARMSFAGWCRMPLEHRTAARCRRIRQGLERGVASGADEFGRGSDTTQSRQPWARPTTVGSRRFGLKQIRADGASAALRNTLPDLANLGCCQRTVVGRVLRQQLDCQFMQRMMNGLRFVDA